ncbi:hypothetical protein D3C78_1294210 [compost metagenome]
MRLGGGIEQHVLQLIGEGEHLHIGRIADEAMQYGVTQGTAHLGGKQDGILGEFGPVHHALGHGPHVHQGNLIRQQVAIDFQLLVGRQLGR